MKYKVSAAIAQCLMLGRNVVNIPQIEDYVSSLSEEPKIQEWCNKVLRKYLINNGESKPLKDIPEDAPDWLSKAVQAGDEVLQVTEHTTDTFHIKIRNVLDYLEGVLESNPNKVLTNMGFDSVVKASEKWHEELARKAKAARKKQSNLEGITVIQKYPDMFWCRLDTQEAYRLEGEQMGHCVGTYYRRHETGSLDIYSLRDNKGKPHVTVCVRLNPKCISEVRGVGNSAVATKYREAVADFVFSGSFGKYKFTGDAKLRSHLLYRVVSKKSKRLAYTSELSFYRVPKKAEIIEDIIGANAVAVVKDDKLHFTLSESKAGVRIQTQGKKLTEKDGKAVMSFVSKKMDDQLISNFSVLPPSTRKHYKQRYEELVLKQYNKLSDSAQEDAAKGKIKDPYAGITYKDSDIKKVLKSFGTDPAMVKAIAPDMDYTGDESVTQVKKKLLAAAKGKIRHPGFTGFTYTVLKGLIALYAIPNRDMRIEVALSTKACCKMIVTLIASPQGLQGSGFRGMTTWVQASSDKEARYKVAKILRDVVLNLGFTDKDLSDTRLAGTVITRGAGKKFITIARPSLKEANKKAKLRKLFL